MIADGPRTRRQRHDQTSHNPSNTGFRQTIETPPAVQMTFVSEEIRRTINQKLEQYEKEINNFVILDNIVENKPQFMKSHKTSIPIGENCQAELPVFIGSDIFAQQAEYYKHMLNTLKISSRVEDMREHNKNLKQFREEMGQDRTEEQFAFSYKFYCQSNTLQNYDEFIKSNRLWLEEYLEGMSSRRGQTKKMFKNSKKLVTPIKSFSTKY